MSNITVHCGINNPECSPSRVFEIESFESLDFESSHMTMTELQLRLNAKLMCILSNCTAIIKGVDINQTIADITIADNGIFYRIMSITKMVKDIDDFKPFYTPLDYVRVVNDFIYETENERAFTSQQYDTLIGKTKHLISCLSDIISDVFIDGLTTVCNGDNDKIMLVPTSSLIKTFNITEKELHYGVSLKCNGKEIVLLKQEWENLTLELDEIVKDKPDIELFDCAMIGVIASFME